MLTAQAAARTGRYLVVLPSAYDGTTPLPLVIDLHGYGESIEIHRLMSNMIAEGEERSFVAVTPEADDPVPRWDASLGSVDTTFLTTVLDQVVATHCVDLARVYVTGLSNGAFMASVMACQLPDRIAAIAPVAGLQDPPGCRTDRPVPVISFHGTADTFVAYEGGLGASVADLPTDDGGTIGTAVVGGDGPSVEEIAAAWAARNGCATEPPTVEAVSDEVDRLQYPGCPPDGQVELYRINGGGHAWPGSAFSQSIEPIIGHTTMTIDATDLIWQFFATHPLGPREVSG
jgi:polyhydroxybutyrate depolymerase